MEEIIAVIVQALIEVLMSAVGQSFIEKSFGRLERSELFYFVFMLSINLIFGILLSIASLHIYPNPFIKNEGLRVLFLTVFPFVSAFISLGFAHYFRKKGKNVRPFFHLIYGFAFSISFGVIRFGFLKLS